MIELIRWIYDFLTTTADKKLDVTIRGIEILKIYAEKNITNENQKIKWETVVKSLIEQGWEARVEADRKQLEWMGEAGRAVRGPDYEYRPSPDEFMREKEKERREIERQERLRSEAVDVRRCHPSESEDYDRTRRFAPPPDWDGRHPSRKYPSLDQPDRFQTPEGELSSLLDQKLKTVGEGLDNIALKTGDLLSKVSLVDEAKADELTDTEKGKEGSGEGRAADTAALLEEMKLQRESLSTQNSETRTALNEMKNQVIFAREAVTGLSDDVATLSIIVKNLKLSRGEEPKKTSDFDYRLDSQYKRI